MKQNSTFEDLEGAYTNERAADYNRLYPWRLHTYWHEEAIPNIYTFDLPSLRYNIYKCWGVRGLQIAINPNALIEFIGASVQDIIVQNVVQDE